MNFATKTTLPLPSSNRLAIFYPSHIKLYLECPQRYYLKHVARVRALEPFSRALARGIALHAVLADCFAEFRAQRSFPINLRERVAFRLAQIDYPLDRTNDRNDDTDDVTAFVKWTLGQFDGDATIVGIEETLGYRCAAFLDCPEFLLRAKVDLVLRHTDGTLEHIDFKGGRAERDSIQEVISRIVVTANVANFNADTTDQIKTTTMFVAEERTVSEVLSREACRETWKTIKRSVRDILTGSHWPPSPSPLCSFCPYFCNGCSIAPAADQATDVTAWLDGEAEGETRLN